MHCTQCGSDADGRFCGACGVTLIEMPCSSCATVAPVGGRFCNACGSPLRSTGERAAGPPSETHAAGGRVVPREDASYAPASTGATTSGGADAGWWISGVLLVLLLVIGGWVFLSDGGTDGATGGAAAAGGGELGPAPHVDLASMSRREAADALFNRVMTALTQGDRVEADRFLPMAIGAYEIAVPLDVDGLFHLSVLQSAAGEYGPALATAEEALAEDPDHLLNLAAAAEAARSLGESDAARERYEHILAVWDRELVREGRAGYDHHRALLPEIREDAEAFLQEGGR